MTRCGANASILIVAEVVTIAVLVCLLIWTTWSWIGLVAVVIPLAIGLPLFLFPYARTFWMALDLFFTRDDHI